jgi:hypothetical protein
MDTLSDDLLTEHIFCHLLATHAYSFARLALTCKHHLSLVRGKLYHALTLTRYGCIRIEIPEGKQGDNCDDSGSLFYTTESLPSLHGPNGLIHWRVIVYPRGRVTTVLSPPFSYTSVYVRPEMETPKVSIRVETRTASSQKKNTYATAARFELQGDGTWSDWGFKRLFQRKTRTLTGDAVVLVHIRKRSTVLASVLS